MMLLMMVPQSSSCSQDSRLNPLLISGEEEMWAHRTMAWSCRPSSLDEQNGSCKTFQGFTHLTVQTVTLSTSISLYDLVCIPLLPLPIMAESPYPHTISACVIAFLVCEPAGETRRVQEIQAAFSLFQGQTTQQAANLLREGRNPSSFLKPRATQAPDKLQGKPSLLLTLTADLQTHTTWPKPGRGV